MKIARPKPSRRSPVRAGGELSFRPNRLYDAAPVPVTWGVRDRLTYRLGETCLRRRRDKGRALQPDRDFRADRSERSMALAMREISEERQAMAHHATRWPVGRSRR
jgi:hypothetical protein